MVLALITFESTQAHAVEWITIGNPGNAAHDFFNNPGAVDYFYEISQFETTNQEWVDFLNAVATTDTFGLYDPSMASTLPVARGGILQTGSPGSFLYVPIAGREALPVNWVSYFDALRYANWMHNGQPAGVQDAGTTEDGSYTITALGIQNNTVERNPNATVVIPTKDEWYKSAYHDAAGLSDTSYFLSANGTDTPVFCSLPPAGSNHANCFNVLLDLVPVGSYPSSMSPHGTFDQAGNVFEWVDSGPGSGSRGIIGGAFNSGDVAGSSLMMVNPNNAVSSVGFRVARVPEPTFAIALSVGAGALFASARFQKRKRKKIIAWDVAAGSSSQATRFPS